MSSKTNLNTNEVKNSAGTEVEFLHNSLGPGRGRIFAQSGETPSLLHRLSINHQELGVGVKRIRRSVCRVDKYFMSTVDATLPVVCSAYNVMVVPIGAITALTEPTNVLAELGSFMFLDGTGTTLLFNGTGLGSECLLNGTTL